MDRRTFIQGAVLTTLSAPALAGARPVIRARQTPRVGVLGHANPTGWTLAAPAIELECRWVDDARRPLSELATELVHRDVDVVVALGNDCACAVRSASTTVPLVVVADDIPVDWPGENVTGVVVPSEMEIARQRLALLGQVVPGLTRVAVLANPDGAGNTRAGEDLRRAAPGQGVDVHVFHARRPEDIGPAFSTMAARDARALVVLPDPLFAIQARDLVDLAAERRLPAVYAARLFVDAGGLMALHGDLADVIRRTAMLVTRILRGERPRTLDVERMDALHLTVNRTTASTFGCAMPRSWPATTHTRESAVVSVTARSCDTALAELLTAARRAPRAILA